LPGMPELTVGGKRASGVDHLFVGLFARERAVPENLAQRARDLVAAALRRSSRCGEEGARRSMELSGSSRLTLFGLGERTAFDVRAARRYVERCVDEAAAADDRAIAVALPEHEMARGEGGGLRAVRDAAAASYRFDRFRSRKPGARLRRVLLVPPAGEGPAFRRGTEVGNAIAAGASWARDLANTPPNEATPAWIAARAREFARRHGARIQVLGPPELRRRRMGGILAVGGGSRNSPRMLRLELGRGPRTIALVGKGVTFDTGGISIKPAAQMDEMKWDKCGACAVLGVLEAVSRLRLPIRLRAYIPLAENMPDGAAYRPGDIVRAANGKTIEILNTDAEGRMILADALAWAAAERPDALLEYSTLTGACVVALGPTGAGLFTPDDELASDLLRAAADGGERLWRLPLWPEFLEEMRAAHADLKNSGSRWGGASTAAAFLSQFVGDLGRWAHLDIAGPAYVGEGKERRGATGFGVALTVEFLRREAEAAPRR